MTRSPATRRAVVLLVVVCGLIGGLATAPAVLLRVGGSPPALTTNPLLTVMNPLRDRGPEGVSARVLQRLRSAECSQELLKFDGEKTLDHVQQVCRHQFGEWWLVDREDTNQRTRSELFFKVRRLVPAPSGLDADIGFVTLEAIREGNAGWRVVHVDAVW